MVCRSAVAVVLKLAALTAVAVVLQLAALTAVAVAVATALTSVAAGNGRSPGMSRRAPERWTLERGPASGE